MHTIRAGLVVQSGFLHVDCSDSVQRHPDRVSAASCKVSRGFLESFSKVSRVLMKWDSGEVRAILHKYIRFIPSLRQLCLRGNNQLKCRRRCGCCAAVVILALHAVSLFANSWIRI